jgi:hypothetical protein
MHRGKNKGASERNILSTSNANTPKNAAKKINDHSSKTIESLTAESFSR